MGPRLRVLLVEDNLGDAVLVRRALERAAPECALSLAGTLGEATALLARGFDAVLLDLTLPDCSGLATLERLRAAAAGVPIVVLTGLDDPGIERSCLEAGAAGYLPKGRLDGAELSALLERAVGA